MRQQRIGLDRQRGILGRSRPSRTVDALIEEQVWVRPQRFIGARGLDRLVRDAVPLGQHFGLLGDVEGGGPAPKRDVVTERMAAVVNDEGGDAVQVGRLRFRRVGRRPHSAVGKGCDVEVLGEGDLTRVFDRSSVRIVSGPVEVNSEYVR